MEAAEATNEIEGLPQRATADPFAVDITYPMSFRLRILYIYPFKPAGERDALHTALGDDPFHFPEMQSDIVLDNR